MKFPFLQRKWLLVFVGGRRDEEQTIETFIRTASELTRKTPPQYRTVRFDTEKTRAFPQGKTLKNELSEYFNDAILNELIQQKNKYGAAEAALIIAKNAFPDEEVFKATIKDSMYDDSVYHLICTWTDFNEAGQRNQCYQNSCARCGKLEESCKHSCLLRLLWLMFNGNQDVLRVFSDS